MQIWLKSANQFMRYGAHKHYFWLKFGSLSPAVTLKIWPRSPNLNQLVIMSQCYLHVNLVKIHPPVHVISCKQESITLAPTPTPTPTPTLTPTPTGSAPKTICPPPLRWLDITNVIDQHVPTFHIRARSWENLFLPYANNKDANQPALPHPTILLLKEGEVRFNQAQDQQVLPHVVREW